MIYSIRNIRKQSIRHNPVMYSRVIGGSKWKTYKLIWAIDIMLSSGKKIILPGGFLWDMASVPQIFQNIIRPSGDDDIAYLIHDYLYVSKITTRKFADQEMLMWATAMKGTKKWSFRNWDIKTRYYMVRLFGWIVWNRKQKQTPIIMAQKYIYRSAKTGRLVTKEFAEANPDTTVREKVKKTIQ